MIIYYIWILQQFFNIYLLLIRSEALYYEKIFALILSIVMSISLAITSTAISNDIIYKDTSSKVYVDEISIANNIISPFGSYSIDYITVLYNLQGDVEAVCVSYNPCGYVIVNINDYSVPEFSPVSSSPYSNVFESKIVNLYNGILNYYTIDDNNLCTDLLTNKTLSSDELTLNYHKEPDTVS